MTGFLRAQIRATACATAAVLVTLVFVTCMPASAATPEKKACCAAMEHACDEPALEMPCCTGQTSPVRGLVATKAAAIVATGLAPADVPHLPPAARAVPAHAAAGIAPVHPRGSPTYLLISSLRV